MKIVVAFVALIALVAAQSNRVEVYNRGDFPQGYTMEGMANLETPISFRVGLTQQNLDKLEEKFWAVSTPGSPEYRNFLSRDEILDLIAPPQADHALVVAWLRAHGVQTIVDHRDSLVVSTTVEVAAKLFDTDFFIFVHERGLKIIRQMGSWSLPAHIDAVVDIVTGISDFPMVSRRLKRTVPSSAPNADGYVVPQTLEAVYNIPSSASASGSSQCVGEFGAGQYFSPSDLATFATQTATPINALSNKHIVGGSSSVGIEGTLDIQYIASAGTDGTNWYWTEANWLYDFADEFFQASDYPDIVSLSYGWYEGAQCQITDQCSVLGVDSQGYVKKVNTEFQKIGTKGVSLFSASGDSGANGRTDEDCTDPTLRPSFPGSSPYITAVGATQLVNPSTNLSNPPPVCSEFSCASGGTETAVSFDESSFTSGGGFSIYSTRPSYQDSAVNAYLSSGVSLPPASYYQANNRGFPDVASLGHNILINVGGNFEAVGGTSASSPSFAGYWSLLNAASKNKSGKPLGFANPLLYKMFSDQPNTFRDITVGDNKCTESGCSSSCKGFECAAGWDPVTGLGVPNVANMLSYVNSNL